MIGTYRPVEVLAREHPLNAVKQELQLHGQCEELPLGLLTERQVDEYLAVRFPGGAHACRAPPRMARYSPTHGGQSTVHGQLGGLSGGSESACATGRAMGSARGGVEATGAGVPESLRQYDREAARATEPGRTAAAGSSECGGGGVFGTAAVAAGLEPRWSRLRSGVRDWRGVISFCTQRG